jgi:hypothetical protein
MTLREELISWNVRSIARRERRNGRIHDRRRPRSDPHERRAPSREAFVFFPELLPVRELSTILSYVYLDESAWAKVTGRN